MVAAMRPLSRKTWPAFLAVTSHKVVLVDASGQYTLHQDELKLYGLTWDRNHIYVSTRYFPDEPGQSAILVFNSSMRYKGQLAVRGLGRNVHQLYVWNRWLYICNADKANIIAYHLDTGKQHTIQWSTEDIHLNCFWKYGNLFYATEHRHAEVPKYIVVLDKKMHIVERIPVHTGFQDHTTSYGIHNVFIHAGNYITLGPSEVLRVDMFRDGALTVKHPLDTVVQGKHFLRGLAAVPGRYFLIGVSHLTERSDRGVGDSRVLITDTRFKVRGEVVLKDVGQILDIRLLRRDLAHNCLPCPYQADWR